MSSEEAKQRQLYNRQEYVVGAATQRKYGATDILVVGLSGVGCELVKNLMLTGIRSITLVDNTPVSWNDLSSLFYATAEDVGKPRATVLEPSLSELNRYVTLSVHDGLVDEALIKKHHVVIFVDHPTTLLVDENEIARRNGVKFVACESRGIVGSIFVDAGDSFTILDTNGEETVSCVVTGINDEGIVMCHDEKKHECCEGDYVYFTNLVSHSFLNSSHAEQRLYKVTKVIGPFILQIEGDGISTAPTFQGSGYMHTTKQPVQVTFKPLKASVDDPSFAFIDDDESKFTAPSALHSIFRALHRQTSKTPLQIGDDRIKAIIDEAKSFDSSLDEKFAELVLEVAPGNLNPMACIIGGLASQEALKCASGKFTPLNQWFYYDCREVLDNGVASVTDRKPRNFRYDGTVAVFGVNFQQELAKKSAFIVGAGALGCELVKNFACLGLCLDRPLHITDMDRIELSNLSRQFLFRHHHIGQPKSKIAAESAKKINSALNILHKEEKVAPETEAIFNEGFWTSLDFAVGALDNVPARKYVDSQCVFYKKALFESGTLGTKCSTQPVIPFLTESYASTYDPPEKGIPVCTLKNFPNAIEHTIQWARDAFEKFFVNEPNDINGYLHDGNFMANLNNDPGNKPNVFARLVTGLAEAPQTPEDCIKWARVQFEQLFHINIKQLLHNLPLDKVTEDGQPFWSGAKKPPKPLDFDANNSLHISFVTSAAHLRAAEYKIPMPQVSAEEVIRVCNATKVPQFVPLQVNFATSEKDKGQQEVPVQVNVTEADLPDKSKYSSLQLHVTEFEKDDDENFHLDFITAVSNLRATNYDIPTEDKMRTKMIAGKIIPAMVTTTALVTGFIGLEILKYLQGIKKLELYKAAFINIALPMVTFTNPVAPKGVEHETPNGKVVWTLWDRFDIDEGRDVTLKELIDLIRSKHHVEASMMSTVEGKLVYSFMTKPDRMKKPVSAVVEEIAKAAIPEGINTLTFVVTPDDDSEVPLVRYRFR